MAESLVIVESPAKARTIKKYLGSGYQVLASIGHIIDLPEKGDLGVDIEKDFRPKYVVMQGKAKVLKQITDAAKKAKYVYLAPDPDREGEAIAWHIADAIKKATRVATKDKDEDKRATKKKTMARSNAIAPQVPVIHRALFHEITSSAIKNAISNPKELNQDLFESQQARRILDRLVGWKISPLLWDKVRRGLSAGRVQSVAVRIVCDREAEIAAFVTKEYWSIVAHLEGKIPPQFESKLIKINGKDFELPNETEAGKIVEALKNEKFKLVSIKKSERKRKPTPPFITSKLQQEAARKLGFTAKKTMALAQGLYEGIDLGEEGSVGLVTYMRTDSPRVSDTALAAVRSYIGKKYGDGFLPEKPIQYQGRKGAQDAHEAIRPTSINYPPEAVEPFLDKDHFRLYDLIWKKFVASQMNPAVYDQTAFDIEAGKYLFRANGQVLKFSGFMAVYMEDEDDIREKDEEENPILPDLTEGEILKTKGIEPHQHFTQPPPRFTEASLVKELEEKGIGRPSTYAAIMSTIQDKEYVKKIENRFHPTDLGKLVNDLLVKSFPEILEIGFTAQMETELDDVEDGKRTWIGALKDFYGPFEKALHEAKDKMRDVKKQKVETDFKCEKCGGVMVVKWGRHGEFLACAAYPKCRTTKEFVRTDDGVIKIKTKEESREVCEKCGKPMVIKRGKFGAFLACTGYPECKNAKAISTGVKCPECGEGEMVQRSSKRGKVFYSCNKYPACKCAIWDKPIPGPCPKCNSPMLVEKYSKKSGETTIMCPREGCWYKVTKE